MDARLAGSAPPPRQPEQLLFRELSNSYSIYVPAPCCALALSVRSLHQLLRLTETGRRKLRADKDAMDYKPSVSRGQQNGASTEGGQGPHPGCWVSWLLSVTAVNTTAKSNSWRKEFITLTHHNHSPSRREAKIGN